MPILHPHLLSRLVSCSKHAVFIHKNGHSWIHTRSLLVAGFHVPKFELAPSLTHRASTLWSCLWMWSAEFCYSAGWLTSSLWQISILWPIMLKSSGHFHRKHMSSALLSNYPAFPSRLTTIFSSQTNPLRRCKLPLVKILQPCRESTQLGTWLSPWHEITEARSNQTGRTLCQRIDKNLYYRWWPLALKFQTSARTCSSSWPELFFMGPKVIGAFLRKSIGWGCGGAWMYPCFTLKLIPDQVLHTDSPPPPESKQFKQITDYTSQSMQL